MSTAALVKTVVDYPLFDEIHAHNSLQAGFDAIRKQFSGLRELLGREDVGAELVPSYIALDPSAIDVGWDELTKGSYSFAFTRLEILLAQEQVLAKLTHDELEDLAGVTLEKYLAKQERPEVYGLGLVSSALLLGRVLCAANAPEFCQRVVDTPDLRHFVDEGRVLPEEVVSGIIDHAERFVSSKQARCP